MKIETKMVKEYGITLGGTWVPYECLEDLEEVHGYEGFAPGAWFKRDIEDALIKAGVAHRSTRGTLFPNMKELKALVESVEWGA